MPKTGGSDYQPYSTAKPPQGNQPYSTFKPPTSTPKTYNLPRKTSQQAYDEAVLKALGFEIGDPASPGSGPGSGSGRSRFSSLAFQLKELGLQREGYEFEQRTGLRDIQETRLEDLEDVNRNALSRGIFDSGIRQRNRNRVNREADQAKGDLMERIRIALARIQNNENLAKAQDAHSAANFSSGGGGGGSDPWTISDPDTIKQLSMYYFQNIDNLDPDLQRQLLALQELKDTYYDIPGGGDIGRGGPR